MNDEESYRFDISGFIVVRGVLSPGELATYNKAIDQIIDGDGDLLPMAGACDPLLQLTRPPGLGQLCGGLVRGGLSAGHGTDVAGGGREG